MQVTLLLYMQSKHRSEIFFETGVFVFSFIESNNHPLCMNNIRRLQNAISLDFAGFFTV